MAKVAALATRTRSGSARGCSLVSRLGEGNRQSSARDRMRKRGSGRHGDVSTTHIGADKVSRPQGGAPQVHHVQLAPDITKPGRQMLGPPIALLNAPRNAMQPAGRLHAQMAPAPSRTLGLLLGTCRRAPPVAPGYLRNPLPRSHGHPRCPPFGRAFFLPSAP